MKTKQYLYAFFVLCLMSSCAKEIVDLTGDIKGIVKDATDGHLIENCLVTITPGNASVSTSQAGVFEFVDLASGEYTLSFKKMGYPEHSQIVSVITGEVKNVDVLMQAHSSFAVSESDINFGDFATTKEFYLVNNSDGVTSFEISNIPSWLTLNRTKGSVNATSQLAITATVDRGAVDYGKYNQNIVITYKGRSNGEVLLPVKFEKVRLTIPEVECDYEASNITQNSFSIKGNLLSTGGSVVYAHGHCWSMHENPTINDSKTDLRERQEIGTFVSSITGLTVNTTYFVRAYAQNAQGISYSEQVVITTQDTHSDKWDGNLAKEFAGGSGKSYDPYIIKTGGQLLLMKDYSNCYFQLSNNIDLNNHNWLPIERFSGTLDGKGFTIYNLRVERSNISYRGLIGNNSGTIKNLTIYGVTIKGDDAGTFAGRTSGQISNCKVVLTQNSLLKGTKVGGIAGSSSGNIDNCTVTSVGDNNPIQGSTVGGIVGYASNTISNCHVNCNIAGEDEVGGIVGYLTCDLLACGYKGKIMGAQYVGGLCGYLRYSSNNRAIVACKADVDITAEDYISGLAGYVDGQYYKIIACYSTGRITCENLSVSGISGLANAGWTAPTCEYCYTTIDRPLVAFGDTRTKINCCYSVYDSSIYQGSHADVAGMLKNTFADEVDSWNFDNCWPWSNGKEKDEKREANLPRLYWE